MKVRQSGMPEEDYWESLFDVPLIVQALGIGPAMRDVAELGCGYGTFTIPVARAISGTLYTFDMDPLMASRTRQRAKEAGLDNIVYRDRDVMEAGFGLPGNSVDAVLLFNILHCDRPLVLLSHAADAATSGAWLLVIHWRYDPATPRGPSLDIRPKPEEIIRWAAQTGKLVQQGPILDLPPWHYGLRFVRT